MFIPIGDEPSEGKASPVNYGLIAVNAVVFLFVQKMGADDGIVERHAFVPAAPSLADAFTSMFLHGGWMHLIGNMLFLWIFGDNVEARLGSVGYLFAYLATGLAAGMSHGLLDSSSAIPSLGASGAIAGVMGIYLVAFPRNRVKMLVWFYYYANVMFVPAWVMIGLYFIVFQNLLPLLIGAGAFGGIAYGAHLGGFVAGVVLGFALKPFIGSRVPAAAGGWAPRAVAGRSVNRSPWITTDPYGGGRTASRFGAAPSGFQAASAPAVDARPDLLALWRSGRREQAADAFAALLRSGTVPSIPEPDFLRLCLWLEENRRFDDARLAFEAFLRSFPSSRGVPLAHFGLGMIYSRHVHDGAAAAPHLETAVRFSPDPSIREAAQRELGRLAGA